MNNMSEELSLADSFCTDYERLLDECQQALSAWSARSEKIRQSRVTGESVGRELLRLQTQFAKCYTVLQKHTRTCERCLAFARIDQIIAELNREEVGLSIC